MIEVDIEELKRLHATSTPGDWHLLGAPWLPRDAETTILAGSPDPHAGRFVCDFENFGSEDGDSPPSNGWQDAAWIAAIHNAFPAIIARLEAAQAKIDALMLEYCPDEMTPEQLENWGKCQRRVSPEREAEIERALSK